MSENRSTRHLPQPFYEDWPGGRRPAAQALWHWHSALARPQPLGGDGQPASNDAFFEEEKERALAGEPMRLVRESVWTAAYEACEAHDLDRRLLAAQVGAAQALQGATRFRESADLKRFVQSWAVPHAQLLASVYGYGYSWAQRHAAELGRGFFHTARLATLPQDLERNRLFLPLSDLQNNDVSIAQLRKGKVSDGVRKLLWKQSVRVRDALGQGQPLLRELSFFPHLHLKRWWFTALELLNEIERREYDLWSRPLELSLWHRAQIAVQTVFGKATARQ